MGSPSSVAAKKSSFVGWLIASLLAPASHCRRNVSQVRFAQTFVDSHTETEAADQIRHPIYTPSADNGPTSPNTDSTPPVVWESTPQKNTNYLSITVVTRPRSDHVLSGTLYRYLTHMATVAVSYSEVYSLGSAGGNPYKLMQAKHVCET